MVSTCFKHSMTQSKISFLNLIQNIQKLFTNHKIIAIHPAEKIKKLWHKNSRNPKATSAHEFDVISKPKIFFGLSQQFLSFKSRVGAMEEEHEVMLAHIIIINSVFLPSIIAWIVVCHAGQILANRYVEVLQLQQVWTASQQFYLILYLSIQI